jgi:hypothetical protein
MVANNATTNNYLKHDEIEKKIVAQQQCEGGNEGACETVRKLDALSAQRDRELATACANQLSADCKSKQAEVRSAYAEIIRSGLSEASVTAQIERLHTQAQADGTLSTGGRTAGLAAGFVQATAEGLEALADGIGTLVLAGQGNVKAGERVSEFVGSAMALADPTLLAQVLSAANESQREQLASAYERGDAYAIGKIGGEVLANLPLGVGSIKSVGGVIKTADQLALEAASATKTVKGVEIGSKFGDQAKLQDHFARHGGDFGAKSAREYQAQAAVFLGDSKSLGVLEKVRANGDIVRFNPSTDEFGVVSGGGVIRTYYKPDPAVHGRGSNLDYFNAQ